jgi:hypothetical protein
MWSRCSLERILTSVALAALTIALWLWVATAHAAPTAKIIRVDPSPSIDGTNLTMRMVVDLGEPRSPSKDLEACGEPSKATEYLACAGDALQKPNAFYAPIPWPPHDKVGAAPDPGVESDHVTMTVRVDDADRPAELVSHTTWGKLAKDDPKIGTSYLILIDASFSMKGRTEMAKAVARAFVANKGKNDIFNIKWFNDATWFSGSGWTNDKKKLNAAISAVTRSSKSPGRSRPLFDLIKSSALEGFGELGNTTQKAESPMHHALVVLSNGWAGTDFGGSPPALATQLGRLFADGILDENNATAPRTPVPIVSVWFPASAMEEAYENARQFMKNLAVPNVGGSFYIVANGAATRGKVIAGDTKARFDRMHVLEWQVPCLAPSTTQNLKLLFPPEEGKAPILGDGWDDVPMAVDPRDWPLDVDKDTTARGADRRPAEPGKTTAIFGNFCWGNDYERAEVYLIGKGDKVPEGGNSEGAKKGRNELTARGLRATPIRSGNNYVEVLLPNNEDFIGDGKARIIVVDGATGRSSPVKEDAVVTLKAQETPMSLRPILEIIFAVLVLGLLAASVLTGGGSRRSRSTSRPKPVVAGGGGNPRDSSVSLPPATPSPAKKPAPTGGAGGGGGAPAGNPAATVMFSATPPAGGVTGATLRSATGNFQITQGREFRLGRDPNSCDFPLQDPHVSAAHCRFKIEAGRLMIIDEASQAGTFINGSRVAPGNWQPVHHGAIVRCGTVDLMVELS